MNLFINSPAYFTQNHGVIDEVYQMCSKISHNIDLREYTSLLDTVGITPILAPLEVLEEGKFKEIKQIRLPYRMANIAIHSSYECFIDGNVEEKKLIVLDNILRSLLVIKKRLREEFDYERIDDKIKQIFFC